MGYQNRRKQQESPLAGLLVVGTLGLFYAVSQHQASLVPIFAVFILTALVFIILVIWNEWRKQQRLVRSGIHDIDRMDGLVFERYLQLLLSQRGYTNVRLTSQNDLGVDLIAEKDGEVWGIQAKRYRKQVGLDAVRQVVAAAKHYNCTRTMVITNSFYTQNARTIARSMNCELIDRNGLIKLILNGQK